ncbi:hypothetical protein AWB92_11670 [Mycobacterium sp. IEC1808]|uniref:hypothetical protein n=1 Tax=Mycobacterium sp. IEC1808 TaxID=1743230 RepID=UPI000A14A2F1|nr:hypothetical protein [Mycobacterium sp. IEC1808]ORW94401.1 hypothetical protein AWB92_11670 [Mycobacterium sp. IEC1808]
MKFTVSILENRGEDKQRRRWSHLFGGRMRTSTLVLIIAFLAVWWVYDTYRPEATPKPPAPQVVPPGFVPDPNYTWVPRSRVQQPPATVTVTPTPTTTPSTTMPPPLTTTTTTPPPFQLPTPPCLLPPPFCPPSSSPTPTPTQLPQPGPGPVPSSPPPAS